MKIISPKTALRTLLASELTAYLYNGEACMIVQIKPEERVLVEKTDKYNDKEPVWTEQTFDDYKLAWEKEISLFVNDDTQIEFS